MPAFRRDDFAFPALMRLPEVMAVTGYSRASIYRLIQQGRFPRPVKLTGGRASGWLKAEVRAVIEAAVADREVA